MTELPNKLAAAGLTDAHIAQLSDPLWRLSSGLYKIVTKSGEVAAFRPKPAQVEVLEAIYRAGRRRIIVPKARQLGFSTLFELIALDTAFFSRNTQCSIIDQTQADASKKLTSKCRFAWEHLPRELREPLHADNGRELEFANGSVISAGMRARGGTNQFLHISEWGPIAHEDPKRSEEIKTGALPSVGDDGLIFVESTYKGGRGGHFYDEIMRALEVPAEHKTAKDFHLMFFPWWRDAGYALVGDMGRVSRETDAYLDEMERQIGGGMRFSPGQRLWYQVTAEEQGIFMKREYPTVLDECFTAPVEGAIYADLVMRARAEGRIYNFAWDRAWPVFTSWDIGHSDTTEIWWWQLRGNRWDIVHHASLKRHSAAQAAHVVREAGLPVAAHFLPHDAGNRTAVSGSNYQTELLRAGLQSVRIVPRTADVWIGINHVRDMLPRAQFNLAGCAEGIGALEVYHSRDEMEAGCVIAEPVHDWSSHAADALRTAAEAIHAGMASDAPGNTQKQRPRRAGESRAVATAEGFRL